jgi:hypothetical protein
VNNAGARIAGLVAFAGIGVLASGGTHGLTEHGVHVAMLCVGALVCAGGVIGALGIVNPSK